MTDARIARVAIGLISLTVATAASAVPSRKAANAALDGALAKAMVTTGPGCVAGIASGGEIIASRAVGSANLELNVPMRTDMAFDIGSTSKQFTAISAAILARRGKLDLDADIRTYLPDMHAFDPPIRVRDLIHHSSGLPDVYEPLTWQFGDPDGNRYPADLTLRMARGMTDLKFKPGTQYEYSNIGYLLLGEIVEKVSGQTLRAFADANIFKPMGMANTAFKDDMREIVPNRASAYSLKADGKTWEWRHSDFDVMGDGGVYSTLADLATWYNVYADPSKLEGGKAARHDPDAGRLRRKGRHLARAAAGLWLRSADVHPQGPEGDRPRRRMGGLHNHALLFSCREFCDDRDLQHAEGGCAERRPGHRGGTGGRKIAAR